MSRSFHITVRHVGVLLVAVAATVGLAGVAQGGQSAPPQSAIDNASATWAMKGYLLDAQGRPVFDELSPLAAIQAASATWAAKARLLDVNGRPITGPSPEPFGTAPTAFSWGEFGIGIGAMLGLVLIAGGLVAGVHAARHHGTRAHPA